MSPPCTAFGRRVQSPTRSSHSVQLGGIRYRISGRYQMVQCMSVAGVSCAVEKSNAAWNKAERRRRTRTWGSVVAQVWSSCSRIWPSCLPLAATLAKRPRRDPDPCRAIPGSGAGAVGVLGLTCGCTLPTRSPTTTVGANLSKWACSCSSRLHYNIRINHSHSLLHRTN